MRITGSIMLLLCPAVASADDGAPRLSSGFGTRADPINGHRAVHRGLDMPGRAGTAVLAAAAGVVRYAGWRGGYGNLVEIAHPDGSATRYAHLSRFLVRPGEAVAQGQVIAQIGSTGRSTGPHLHFEYRLAGAAVDPAPFFGSAPTMTYRSRTALPTVDAPHRSRFAQARAVAGPTDPTQLPTGSDISRRDAR